jgi:FtsP/CotA-like multicopper oxidase with cupredoxin domain
VPGIASGFNGTKPGETFTYRFLVRQHGTFWYHSHSGFQEQTGLYGPIVIDPRLQSIGGVMNISIRRSIFLLSKTITTNVE